MGHAPAQTLPLHEAMPPTTGGSARGKYLALGLTLAVHLALLALLVFGVRWTTQVNHAVEVELVRAEDVTAPAAAVAEVKPPHPPAFAPRPMEPRPVEPRPAPPLHKPDIALKDEEKKKPPPKAVPVPQPPPPQEDPFRKQLEQELRQTTAQRRAADYSNDAARELAHLQQRAANAASARATADYIARIRGRIRSNIVLPHDINGNPEAVFEVTQFPSGEILDVKLKRSSGHAGYDAAVERAIRKSSPLPKPGQADLFSRELELKFRPLED
ncbi:MAG: TonB C-terminal domain-containing protein [Sterolibacterium sp.]|jgi:colicin import membrane protein|nr:TonB C-terminal domain-containing protein [Sterolibacterium sp.]